MPPARRPIRACNECRQKKRGCDKQTPCSYCQQKNISCERAAFKTPEIEQHKKAEHQEMRDETQYTALYDPCLTLPMSMLAQSSQVEGFSKFVPMQQLSFHKPQYSPAPSQGGELEFNLPQSLQACYWELGILKSRFAMLNSEMGILNSEMGILNSEMGMLKSKLNEGDSKSSR